MVTLSLLGRLLASLHYTQPVEGYFISAVAYVSPYIATLLLVINRDLFFLRADHLLHFNLWWHWWL